MERINLADAKARLSEIVDRVEAGESIEIDASAAVAAGTQEAHSEAV